MSNERMGHPDQPLDNPHADAALICAAPDLLAALRRIRTRVSGHGADTICRLVDAIASAAIARAEGRG